MTYRIPFLQVLGPHGGDLVKIAGSQLVGARLVDRVDDVSDEAVFTFTHKAPFFQPPPVGTPYEVRAGWSENDVAVTGTYTLQRLHYRGVPREGRQLQLICRAADFVDRMKNVGSEHFDKENGHSTYGDVFRSLGKQLGVEVVIPEKADKTPIKSGYHLRWEQSVGDALVELGQELGFAVKPAGGKLVILDRGEGASASGKPLRTIEIRFDQNYEYEVDIEPRYQFQSVSATYFDPATGTLRSKDKQGGPGQSKDVLPFPSASEDAALNAAAVAAQEWGRFSGTGLFVMAGDPSAVAGAPVRCSGFGPGIDAIDWEAEVVTHDIQPNGGGWLTTVETTKSIKRD